MAKTQNTKTTTKSSKSSTKSKMDEAKLEPVKKEVTEEVSQLESEDTVLDNELRTQFIEFTTKMHQLSTLIHSMRSEFKVLTKRVEKDMKVLQRSSAKKKRAANARMPSGFVKPAKISDALADFLDKSKGSEMARTEVTREINAYIRAHSLQDKNNGRRINADSKLKNLLNLTPNDELTYFNLQKYMSPHFQKESQKVTS